jgi:hypothetical protein
MLKLWTLERIVRFLERRRPSGVTRPNAAEPELQQLVFTFRKLRPWLYTARDGCLFDSLAMVDFLYRRSISAVWVIGVRTANPFAAHSWVQYGDLVLNDDLVKVEEFTPILYV